MNYTIEHQADDEYYLVNENDLLYIYGCVGSLIYLFVAYAVYHYYLEIINIVMFTGVVMFFVYCILALCFALDEFIKEV
jgi:hypothetical protein